MEEKKEQETGKLKDFFRGIWWTVILGAFSGLLYLVFVLPILWVVVLITFFVKKKKYTVLGMLMGLPLGLLMFWIVCGAVFQKIGI